MNTNSTVKVKSGLFARKLTITDSLTVTGTSVLGGGTIILDSNCQTFINGNVTITGPIDNSGVVNVRSHMLYYSFHTLRSMLLMVLVQLTCFKVAVNFTICRQVCSM